MNEPQSSRRPPAPQPARRGGSQRQGVGEAFFMSLIRQIARSIGSAIVRMFLSRRR